MRHDRRHKIEYSVLHLCSCLLVLVTFALPLICHASSPQTQYERIQKKIKTQRQKLERVKKYESSILSDIDQTNRQMKKVDNLLQNYRTRLSNTESRIARIEREIASSRKAIQQHRQWIKRKLRTIYKYGRNADVVLLLLAAPDISQLIRTNKNLEYLTVHEQKQMSSYESSVRELQAKEAQLVLLKKDLSKDREKVLAEESSLAAKRKQKQQLLASVQRKKSSHTAMLREMEESARRLLEIIKKSEQGEIFPGRGFASLKGKLPWPVEGKVIIPYGSQKDPQFNTPVFRSGTFIQSQSGTKAKVVSQGKVVFAEWFKGYGQLVIVNHGEGYHSLYGSLSEIFTRVGDIIKDGQMVGRVGNSGLVNTSGLYFELRYRGKPLNPMQWLRRR